MISARYWRFVIQEPNGHSTQCSVAELQFLSSQPTATNPTGSPLAGTRTAATADAGLVNPALTPVGNANDGSTSTYWTAEKIGGSWANFWTHLDLGVTGVCWGVRLTGDAIDATRSPKTFRLEYSINGTAWYPAMGWVTKTDWTTVGTEFVYLTEVPETRNKLIAAAISSNTNNATISVSNLTSLVAYGSGGSMLPGDLAVLVVVTANQAPPSTPAGWAVMQSLIGTGTAGGTAAVGVTVFAKYLTHTEASNGFSVTTGDSGDHQLGVVYVVRGPTTTLDAATTQNIIAAASTAAVGAAITTVTDQALVLQLLTTATDAAEDPITSAGTSYPSEIRPLAFGNYEDADARQTAAIYGTALFDMPRRWAATTAGNGSGLAVILGEADTAGAVSAATATLTTSSVQANITLAFRPALEADIDTATHQVVLESVVSGDPNSRTHQVIFETLLNESPTTLTHQVVFEVLMANTAERVAARTAIFVGA